MTEIKPLSFWLEARQRIEREDKDLRRWEAAWAFIMLCSLVTWFYWPDVGPFLPKEIYFIGLGALLACRFTLWQKKKCVDEILESHQELKDEQEER